jgi:hypothetical protein
MVPSSDSEELSRRRQLAHAIAEHIALTISNLDMRAALEVQATRDPLTGLYSLRKPCPSRVSNDLAWC